MTVLISTSSTVPSRFLDADIVSAVLDREPRNGSSDRRIVACGIGRWPRRRNRLSKQLLSLLDVAVGVEVVDSLNFSELSDLREVISVLHRVEWILVLHLDGEKMHEVVGVQLVVRFARTYGWCSSTEIAADG